METTLNKNTITQCFGQLWMCLLTGVFMCVYTDTHINKYIHMLVINWNKSRVSI